MRRKKIPNKPNGENIISIRRDATQSAFVLSVGGFDMTLGGNVSDYADEYNPYLDTMRWERKIIKDDPTPGREVLTYAYFPRRSEKDNTIWVSRVNNGVQGKWSRYDSVIVTTQNDTIYSYSSETAPAYNETRYNDYICLCGCGKKGCTCGKASYIKGNTSTEITVGSSRVKHTHKRHKETSHFSFGFLGFDGDAGKMKLNHGRSISIGVDLRHSVALNRSRNAWFSMGLRPRWDNYVFRDNITLGREGGRIVAVPLEAGNRFKKSKLGVFSIDVPVAFEFRILRAITLETGVYGGMALGDRTKVKFPKEKDRGNWNTNFWQAGATVRLKVKPIPFGVFGTYSFTPLFENGAGPKLQPFTIGIYL